jgi:uncharacterized BrkB/YihY/UPF0761 family membrane protein
MNIGLSFVVIAALFFYLLPSMIASIRNVEHGGAIVAVNVFFGWTVLGWIAVLICAVVEKPREAPKAPTGPERVSVHPDGTLTVSREAEKLAGGFHP